MILQCVLVGRKIFQTRDDAKLGRERSFRNSPAARSEKIFRGLVWDHHSLKISFGLREHTVMPHFTNETKPSKGKINCPRAQGVSASYFFGPNKVPRS